MGTRSLTRVQTENGQKILNIYRQFDGYPSGHGSELYEFLSEMRIVNGYQPSDRMGKVANGAGCLAAQMVAKFKEGIGGIYLYPFDANDCGQYYEYIVLVNEENSIRVQCISYAEVKFDGSVEQFGKFCISPEDEDEEE